MRARCSVVDLATAQGLLPLFQLYHGEIDLDVESVQYRVLYFFGCFLNH